jgi:ABC-type enterochelin transport system permease subunit
MTNNQILNTTIMATKTLYIEEQTALLFVEIRVSATAPGLAGATLTAKIKVLR